MRGWAQSGAISLKERAICSVGRMMPLPLHYLAFNKATGRLEWNKSCIIQLQQLLKGKVNEPLDHLRNPAVCQDQFIARLKETTCMTKAEIILWGRVHVVGRGSQNYEGLETGACNLESHPTAGKQERAN